MLIGVVINILEAFERYVNFLNNNGYDELIKAIKEDYNALIITMRGHMGETYDIKVYLSDKTGELCVESIDGTNILEITCSEYKITEKERNYILFGE